MFDVNFRLTKQCVLYDYVIVFILKEYVLLAASAEDFVYLNEGMEGTKTTLPDGDTALLYSAIDTAKRSLSPYSKLDDWKWFKQKHRNDNKKGNPPVTVELLSSSIVAVNGRQFEDNVDRNAVSSVVDLYGDSLPKIPAVLMECLNKWPAYKSSSWSLKELSKRVPVINHPVSLDGGPGFARMSMNTGYVTLQEYQYYCKHEADEDLAPLYVFDPKILQLDCLRNDIGIPPSCFSHDMMSCIQGSEYRPLPPAWLLIGAARSGTPIHDHPLTIAWNALLEGCKLWVSSRCIISLALFLIWTF